MVLGGIAQASFGRTSPRRGLPEKTSGRQAILWRWTSLSAIAGKLRAGPETWVSDQTRIPSRRSCSVDGNVCVSKTLQEPGPGRLYHWHDPRIQELGDRRY